jgi:DMSO/TMAO reductase YedYZ molybdopterin-dependent catalytic subunit
MPLEGLRYDLTPLGLHYLLIHFDIPHLSQEGYSLNVGGRVARERSFTMEELRARPRVRMPVTMECAGNGRAWLDPRPLSQPWLNEAVGTAEWTGTPLAPILEDCGLAEDAVELVFTGADHGVQGGVEQDYERSLTVEQAMDPDVLLAYEIDGVPLPPQHGFPLRLLVPGWYGMTSVKWLVRIAAVAVPFDGFQMDAYRLRDEADEPGTPVTRIRPRALILPPGFPDFFTRTRMTVAGPCLLEGRAWSGWGEIVRVEVSDDDGATWSEAAIEPPAAVHAWSRWTFEWLAEPGDRVLRVRATDAEGNVQPLDQPWNLHGLENNMAQRVPVTVAAR